MGSGASVESAAAELESYAEVEYAEPNYYVFPQYVPDDSYFSRQWGLNNTGQDVNGVVGTPGADIGAAAAWDIERGLSNPVTVAVLDSGIKFDHPDLDGSIWTNEDEIPDNGIDDDGNGYVDDAHGYNFAGISQTLFFYKSGGTYVPRFRNFGTGTSTMMLTVKSTASDPP